MIQIGSIGYNHSHDASFVMDRPNGPGTYLFLLIKSDARFVISGQEYKVAKGSFIIIDPSTPCYYRALVDVYCDDWFYFGMDESDISALNEMGIYLNVPTYLGDVDELSRIILSLTYEHYSLDEYNQEIEQKYIDILIMKLSRAVKTNSKIPHSMLVDKKTSLINLRTMIYNEPDRVLDVTAMSQSVGMSRSGLQHNYKKMFGVSIMQDVITSRIERAKRRLIGTNASISQIAKACGYNCEYSFMRQFKERTGFTPTEYRNTATAGEFELGMAQYDDKD